MDEQKVPEQEQTVVQNLTITYCHFFVLRLKRYQKITKIVTCEHGRRALIHMFFIAISHKVKNFFEQFEIVLSYPRFLPNSNLYKPLTSINLNFSYFLSSTFHRALKLYEIFYNFWGSNMGRRACQKIDRRRRNLIFQKIDLHFRTFIRLLLYLM